MQAEYDRPTGDLFHGGPDTALLLRCCCSLHIIIMVGLAFFASSLPLLSRHLPLAHPASCLLPVLPSSPPFPPCLHRCQHALCYASLPTLRALSRSCPSLVSVAVVGAPVQLRTLGFGDLSCSVSQLGSSIWKIGGKLGKSRPWVEDIFTISYFASIIPSHPLPWKFLLPCLSTSAFSFVFSNGWAPVVFPSPNRGKIADDKCVVSLVLLCVLETTWIEPPARALTLSGEVIPTIRVGRDGCRPRCQVL